MIGYYEVYTRVKITPTFNIRTVYELRPISQKCTNEICAFQERDEGSLPWFMVIEGGKKETRQRARDTTGINGWTKLCSRQTHHDCEELAQVENN